MLTPFAPRKANAVVADLACFGVASTLSWVILRPPFAPGLYASTAALGAGCTALAFQCCDAYKPAVLGSRRGTLRAVLRSAALALLVALGAGFLAPLPQGALLPMLQTLGLHVPLVLLARAGFRSVSRRAPRRLVVIGAGGLGEAIALGVRELSGLGIELVGFIAEDAFEGTSLRGFPVLGEISMTEKILKDLDVDWIVVACQDRSEPFPAEVLLGAKLRGCRVDSGLVFFERLAGRIYLPGLRWSTLIFADGLRPRILATLLKRGLDLALASVGLVLAAPVLALAAIAIRIESSGPILFRQTRVGRGDRPFDILKLRSMQDHAEEATGAICVRDGDERITRVGRFLRRTHLDELPQLWNVLVGEMSLVGPRPERPEFAESLTDRLPLFRFRSALKPGLTGWAQVRQGYAGSLAEFERKLSFDLYYLKHRSLTLDLVILWETVKAVVLLRGI
jgi:exopolysaccharide biosynthesis polyprenyl glycosylphosphotransferase